MCVLSTWLWRRHSCSPTLICEFFEPEAPSGLALLTNSAWSVLLSGNARLALWARSSDVTTSRTLLYSFPLPPSEELIVVPS